MMGMGPDGTPTLDPGRGTWISLFSGGKDSSYALYRALQEGLTVGRLLTVSPQGDSYLYHVPATDLAGLAARSIGIDLVEVRPDAFETGDRARDHAAGPRGDREVKPLEAALDDLDGRLSDGVAGVIAGAIASEYQTSRITAMCDRLGIGLFAPLWGRDPWVIADELLASEFEVRVIQVAAAGLDESWLGRTLDPNALTDLRELNDRYGVHPLGEGGEFETLVVNGPHMDRRIDLEYETVWEGDRGHLRITRAVLD